MFSIDKTLFISYTVVTRKCKRISEIPLLHMKIPKVRLGYFHV